ncbi:hypothetical protein NC652_010344 [Populus alba x Populus x berolinensis]|nr:hypothetical protein NC652_010344 [Populus alba x Populus x berolinensis]
MILVLCYHEQTRFIVSYKVSEFNETEFEEYDPTAFGGSYDPAATYGKPLPPSDKICYTSSTPDPNALSLNGVSYGSITAPYGKDEVNEPAPKPRSERKPLRLPAIEAAPLSLEHGNGKGNSQEKSLVLHKGEESEENEGDHHDSLPGYDAGYCNGSSGELGYEHARNDNDRQQATDCGSYGNQGRGLLIIYSDASQILMLKEEMQAAAMVVPCMSMGEALSSGNSLLTGQVC